jgi:hypothetical protein
MNPAGRGTAGAENDKSNHGTQKPVECFADALEMGRYFVKCHGPGTFRGVLIRW